MKIKHVKEWRSTKNRSCSCTDKWCGPRGQDDCRPVRVYPEKVGRLMEMACRLVNDSPMRGDMESWRKQWAKLIAKPVIYTPAQARKIERKLNKQLEGKRC